MIFASGRSPSHHLSQSKFWSWLSSSFCSSIFAASSMPSILYMTSHHHLIPSCHHHVSFSFSCLFIHLIHLVSHLQVYHYHSCSCPCLPHSSDWRDSWESVRLTSSFVLQAVKLKHGDLSSDTNWEDLKMLRRVNRLNLKLKYLKIGSVTDDPDCPGFCPDTSDCPDYPSHSATCSKRI